MRVTPEMVERAARALLGNVLDSSTGRSGAVRAALEAALAPLPEPEPGICVTLDGRELWAMETDRADAAEAKLEKVREWSRWMWPDDFACLEAILDGEP